MIFDSNHQEIAKLGPQRITVKSSEISQLPLLAELSIGVHRFVILREQFWFREISEKHLKGLKWELDIFWYGLSTLIFMISYIDLIWRTKLTIPHWN